LEARAASNLSLIPPIRVAELPVVKNLRASGDESNQAVLSWRWDVDSMHGTSRNVTAALAYAFTAGIEHLFMDAVSIDQTLSGLDLIRAVADFTALFGYVPVIAAYDSAAPLVDPELRHFLRVVRRPWIAREVRAMRYNPHKLRYVGYIAGQGADANFGFAHMLEAIWSTSFANSILYVLTGYCDMYDVSELQLIMPEYHVVLAAAAKGMSRNDVFITAAILSQLSTDDSRINGDIDIRRTALDNYTFSEVAGSAGYWSNWEIVLNGRVVGLWSEKDYTRDGTHRRKLSAVRNAHELLAAYLNVGIASDETVREEPMSPTQLENYPEDIEIIDLSSRFTT
jgi:hypothetical protein